MMQGKHGTYTFATLSSPFEKKMNLAHHQIGVRQQRKSGNDRNRCRRYSASPIFGQNAGPHHHPNEFAVRQQTRTHVFKCQRVIDTKNTNVFVERPVGERMTVAVHSLHGTFGPVTTSVCWHTTAGGEGNGEKVMSSSSLAFTSTIRPRWFFSRSKA